MSLTPRQMLVLVALIVGFAIAALVARGDGGGGVPEIDTAAWCDAAVGLEGTGPLFDGTAETATTEDYEAATDALFDVEVLAPFELRPGIARLADFSLIAGQQLAEHDWPTAWEEARTMVDTEVVDQAIEDMDTELAACGHDFFG